MKQNLHLPAGYCLEFWASGDGFLHINIDAKTVWQVPYFAKHPEFFKYHHREACEVTVVSNAPGAILWAYGYHQQTVNEVGITVFEFSEEGIIQRTGAAIDHWLRSDPDRPILHFSPIRQWMNDPNGLCKVGDTWHVFYQFHPASTDWGPMHWGHATSKDLFNWTHLPVFMHPEQNYWRLGATGGAFSGTAFHDQNDKMKFYYTERLPAYDLFKGYREIQKIAEPDDDLITVEKISTIIRERPPGVSHDFRDPKVWWDKSADEYKMVLGASIDDDPAVLLYRSMDGENWQYIGPIYRAPSHFRESGARAIECPDFFPLGNKWVIVMGFVGYTERDSGRKNLLYAQIGDFKDDQFVSDRDSLQLLDFGTDFYALQSFEADGRRLAFAWLFNWECRKPLGSIYSGELSIPRELFLSDDLACLCMKPAQEFEALERINCITRGDGNYILQDAPIEIRLEGDLEGTRISAEQDSEKSFEISLSNGTIAVTLPQDDGSIRYESKIGAAQDLRIVHDKGIVEVFISNGIICGTRRSYQNIAPNSLVVDTQASIKVFTLTTRQQELH